MDIYLDIKERLEDCTEPIKKPKIEPNNINNSLSSIIKVVLPKIIKAINDIFIMNLGPILSSKYEKKRAPIPAEIFIKIPNIIISVNSF